MLRSGFLLPVSFVALAVVGIASIGAGPSFALEPKKPSELRTVGTGGGACPGIAGAKEVKYLTTADGVEIFAVPAGNVFVIESWDWWLDAGTTTLGRMSSWPRTGRSSAL
jgi:hypothetical protein